MGDPLIKMATFEFPTGATPDEMLVGVSTAVPVFPIMMLVFAWFFIFLTGCIKQNRRAGYSNMPQWATLASLGTLLLSLALTISEGIIAAPILLIVVAVTILSAVWFFMSRGRFE